MLRNALSLFMFVHNQVYSGHFFHYFMCSWGSMPNQWSQFLCWARPWVMVIPRWCHCFTDAPERPRVPLESKLLWLWHVAELFEGGDGSEDELSPSLFHSLEVLSYSSVFLDSFLFITLSLLTWVSRRPPWIYHRLVKHCATVRITHSFKDWGDSWFLVPSDFRMSFPYKPWLIGQ